MRAIIISGLLFFLCLHVTAQTVNFYGVIADERGNPIPFSSVWLHSADKGTLANDAGAFTLSLKPGKYTITFRHDGYRSTTQNIAVYTNQEYNLTLHSIPPVTPANVDTIIAHVIRRRRSYRLKLPGYEGELYSKQLQQLDGAPKTFLKSDIAHKLNLTDDHKGIISLSESISKYHTRKTDYIQEEVTGARTTSSSNAFNFNSAPELHVNFYKNNLVLKGLSDHAFLSPIAGNARHFYKYALTGQFYDNGKLIYVISVHPFHKNEHLFNGTIYVVDKDWLLYSVELHLAHNAHIDFVDSVSIKQQFVPVSDGNWAEQAMLLRFYGKLLGFKYSGYFLQLYKNIAPDTSSAISSRKEVYHSDGATYQQNDQFWLENRALTFLPAEERFYRLTSLQERHRKDKTLADSLQNTNNQFIFWTYIFNGYTLHNYRDNSLWIFPSPDNLWFYNTVEGYGINLFTKYNKIYSNQHSLSIIPNARYGFSDKIFNASIFVDYIYNPFHQASVYGRVGSDFLDLNDKGTISPFINSLSTLFLGNNYIKLYQSKFVLAGTDGEVANGVLLNGQFEYAKRRPLINTTLHTFNKDSVYLTSNNPLDPNSNTPLFPAYNAFILTGSATFTFDQQYKITPAGKFIMPNPYPRVRLNYREGLPVAGSNVDYVFTSVDVFQDRVNMGIYGYTAYFLSAGKFFNTTSLYYPDFNQFSGGESFFFNASLGSFHFLNFYTYSTDRPYFEAHVEHNFAGYFLSHVPLLNKLNLQEIVGGSYLTQGTLPDYKEVYVGLKRTVIRLDYGLAYGRFTKVVQGFRFSYNW